MDINANIPLVDIKDNHSLLKLLIEIRDSQDRVFTSVIIDHMRNLDRMFTQEILSQNVTWVNGKTTKPNSLIDPLCKAFAFNKGYEMLAAKWDAFFQFIKAIRNKHSIAFFILGHSKIEKEIWGLTRYTTNKR